MIVARNLYDHTDNITRVRKRNGQTFRENECKTFTTPVNNSGGSSGVVVLARKGRTINRTNQFAAYYY